MKNNNLLPLIHNFLIALYNNKLNLNSNKFKNYKQLILWLSWFNDGSLIKDYNIDEKFLKRIKESKNEIKRISWSLERQNFCDYVKQTFPNFNSIELLNPQNIVTELNPNKEKFRELFYKEFIVESQKGIFYILFETLLICFLFSIIVLICLGSFGVLGDFSNEINSIDKEIIQSAIDEIQQPKIEINNQFNKDLYDSTSNSDLNLSTQNWDFEKDNVEDIPNIDEISNTEEDNSVIDNSVKESNPITNEENTEWMEKESWGLQELFDKDSYNNLTQKPDYTTQIKLHEEFMDSNSNTETKFVDTSNQTSIKESSVGTSTQNNSKDVSTQTEEYKYKNELIQTEHTQAIDTGSQTESNLLRNNTSQTDESLNKNTQTEPYLTSSVESQTELPKSESTQTKSYLNENKSTQTLTTKNAKTQVDFVVEDKYTQTDSNLSQNKNKFTQTKDS